MNASARPRCPFWRGWHPCTPTKKGPGFVQPLGPHMHWHVDLAVITIGEVVDAAEVTELSAPLDAHGSALTA